jgi:hypothetical protein
MTVPTFTAEASFYRTYGRYQTSRGRQAANSSAQMLRPIWPALREDEGKVIHLHSCPPGFSDIGGSCWPNPLTEPPGGGGDGWPPGGPGDGGGGGAGGDTKCKSNKHYNPHDCDWCNKICELNHPINPCW